MARTARRVARRGGGDPHGEPGLAWGWHGSFPNRLRIAGVVVAILLVLLIFGPYQSRTQDLWMIPMALGILALIVRGTIKRRNAWRR